MKPLAFLMLVAACAAVPRVAGGAQQATPQAPAAAAPDAPSPSPDYSYDPGPRRDPFVSLVRSGTDAREAAPRATARPDGVAGVLVDEVAVRGIVQTRGSWVAMIAAPNGRSYTIRPGDRLMDGTVRAISQQAVVLMQEVKDPLSLEKQREVRKQLRGEVK